MKKISVIISMLMIIFISGCDLIGNDDVKEAIDTSIKLEHGKFYTITGTLIL